MYPKLKHIIIESIREAIKKGDFCATITTNGYSDDAISRAIVDLRSLGFTVWREYKVLIYEFYLCIRWDINTDTRIGRAKRKFVELMNNAE